MAAFFIGFFLKTPSFLIRSCAFHLNYAIALMIMSPPAFMQLRVPDM